MDATGFKGQLTFPVIVYKGKTRYNIPSLEMFLDSLLTGI